MYFIVNLHFVIKDIITERKIDEMESFQGY